MPEMSIRASRDPAGWVQRLNSSTRGGETGAGPVTFFSTNAISYHHVWGLFAPGRTEVSDLFRLTTEFQPKGDQPEAIRKLAKGLVAGKKHQVLLGVTGSGKTFTMA